MISEEECLQRIEKDMKHDSATTKFVAHQMAIWQRYAVEHEGFLTWNTADIILAARNALPECSVATTPPEPSSIPAHRCGFGCGVLASHFYPDALPLNSPQPGYSFHYSWQMAYRRLTEGKPTAA